MNKVRLDMLVSQQAKEALALMAAKQNSSMSKVVENLIINGSDVVCTDDGGDATEIERRLDALDFEVFDPDGDSYIEWCMDRLSRVEAYLGLWDGCFVPKSDELVKQTMDILEQRRVNHG